MEELGIKSNIEKIVERVSKVCDKIQKNIDDITIIAVSKTVDWKKARQAIDAGILNLGENRVQELVSKYENLENLNANWHMIGHLQKNKVKYIIDKVKLIHSVESFELASEIDKRAKQNNIVANILIEINVGEEESKFGISKDNAVNFVKSLESFENIKINGIMTVAPYSENPENIRWVFKEMKNLYDVISKLNSNNIEMKYLSMGMTNDFEIAIEEGSNMVRIGTAIFGERKYKYEEEK